MAYKKGDRVKYYDSCKLFHNLPDVRNVLGIALN